MYALDARKKYAHSLLAYYSRCDGLRVLRNEAHGVHPRHVDGQRAEAARKRTARPICGDL